MKTLQIALFIFGFPMIGCGWHHARADAIGISQVDNDSRIAVAWPKNPSGTQVACVEFASPISKAAGSVFTAGGGSKAPLQDFRADLTRTKSESISKIYSVDEVLQFSHAALFRLCEAYGNGAVAGGDAYQKLFSEILANSAALMKEKMSGAQSAVRALEVDRLEEKVKESGVAMTIMQDVLDNPNLPEDQKAILRKVFSEVGKGESAATEKLKKLAPKAP